MKYQIPIRNDYIEPRKISRLNLENLFATLQHLIQLTEPVYQGKLVGLLGQIYNNMIILYGLDPVGFIAEVKLVRRWFIEYVRGGDTSQGALDDARWNFDLGSPVLLGGFVTVHKSVYGEHRLESTIFFLRVIYSMLCADRVIDVPVVPSYKTITDPCYEDVNSKAYPTVAEIDLALKILGITKSDYKERYAEYCRNFRYEILSTRGPNGLQTWSAHLDARTWARTPDLFPKLRSFLEESKLNRILKDMIGCISVDRQEVLPKGGLRLGKLSIVNEWGGKARIVAALDYWTQMAFTPLHHTINHFLRLLPTDGTFNQEAIADRVQEWTRQEGIVMNSFDLKAATDRLPITLQKTILERLYGSAAWAENWKQILNLRYYTTPNGDDITYETGQPMGARSSFPMLALTHHVIVMIAAIRAGVKAYDGYVILGDDITLTGADVAIHYKDIMKALDVTIQESKSVLYRQGALPAAEICKRVYVDGYELSVFNAKEMVKTIKDGRLSPTLQNDLLSRGWGPQRDTFWTFMAAMLDSDNLTMLLKMNLMPKSITGLKVVITPDTRLTDLKLWFKDIDLQERDLTELFTFIVATEQLKRLDSVLKAGSQMTDALSIMAAHENNPKAIPQHIRDIWIHSTLSEAQVTSFNAMLEGMGPITYNHPVLSAAREETNRISELLHALNSFDPTMVASARQGLLEACRSAVGQMWSWGSPPPVQEMRALLAKMLTTLASMIVKHRNKPTKDGSISINYSVTLTSIGRLWNVYFKLGGVTSVNALRASVSRTVAEASKTLSDTVTDLHFEPTQAQQPRPSENLSKDSPSIAISPPEESQNSPKRKE